MNHSKVVESLRILYQRRRARGNDTELSNREGWLDPTQPLTEAELRDLAEAVYDLMRQELRQERERHEGW